ncbi:hypothetical protein ASG24_12135 [Methylophilus sp. Leaf414]|nr:hypothetical protein ASG24_12135 [Methylophilus sp. Leaf414]
MTNHIKPLIVLNQMISIADEIYHRVQWIEFDKVRFTLECNLFQGITFIQALCQNHVLMSRQLRADSPYFSAPV